MRKNYQKLVITFLLIPMVSLKLTNTHIILKNNYV